MDRIDYLSQNDTESSDFIHNYRRSTGVSVAKFNNFKFFFILNF